MTVLVLNIEIFKGANFPSAPPEKSCFGSFEKLFGCYIVL